MYDEIPYALADRLRPYQLPAVRAALTGLRSRGFLDGSDGGTGKTYSALATCISSGKTPIVVCPKSVKPSWQRAGHHFGLESVTSLNYESVKTGNTPLGKWENDEKGREYFQWTLPDNSLLIFDEAHKCGALTSQNTHMHLFAQCLGLPILNLSGTPAENPLQLRAIGSSIGLFDIKDFYEWVYSKGCRRGQRGWQWTFGLNWKKKEEIRALQEFTMLKIHEEIYHGGKGFRLRKRDIPGFPLMPVISQPLDLGSATGDIAKAYEEMALEIAAWEKKVKDLEVDIESGSGKEALGNKMEIQMRAMQKIELLKVPAVVEMVKESIAAGHSVPIFVNYTETLKALCQRLKTDCFIDGSQVGPSGEKRRESCIKRFQSDDSRVIVANSQAGGLGISLHDLNGNYPRETLIFPSFRAKDLLQCTWRIERDGSLTEGIQRIVWCAGTREEESAMAVEMKTENLSMLSDGDLESSIRIFNN